MKRHQLRTNVRTLLFYLIPVVFLLFTLASCFSSSIWVDESFSLALTTHPVAEIIRLDALDVHPPLYYLLLKIALSLAKQLTTAASIYVGKIVSVIPSLLLLLTGFTWVRRSYGRRIAFFFNLFLVSMPQMAHNAVEIRMYSWGLLFVTCGFLAMLELIAQKGPENSIPENGYRNRLKYWLILTICAVLSAYTHYFACISVMVVYGELYVILIVRKQYDRLKGFFLSGAAVVALYLPWLSCFMRQLQQVRENYWIPPITPHNLLSYAYFPMKGESDLSSALVLLTAGFCLGGILLSWIRLRKKGRHELPVIPLCGFLVLYGTVLSGVILSSLIRPIFMKRYMVCALGCFWFSMAWGMSGLVEANWKWLLTAAACTALLAAVTVHKDFIRVEQNFRKETNRTLNALQQTAGAAEHGILLSDYIAIHQILAVYFPDIQNVLCVDHTPQLMRQVYGNSRVRDAKQEDLPQNRKEPFWLVEYRESTAASLEQSGFHCELLGTYRIEDYDAFRLYRVLPAGGMR